jgi:anti-sigma factor RsiW
MRMMSCQGARQELSAFHDGELPTQEQFDVESHLRGCASCADDAAALDVLGDGLRARAARTAAMHEADLEGLQSEILNRIRVEQEESVPAQVGRMFEDMRLGFVALGSTAASIVSILLVIVIFSFGPQSERPDSLSGMIQTMGTPPSSVDVRDLVGQQIGEPTAQDREAMSARMAPLPVTSTEDPRDAQLSEEDAVFALAAVVTRQGRIASLEVVRADQRNGSEREQILRLLDQVSRSRLEPAKIGGAPVAVRRVWVMASTTVRAKLLPVLPKQSWMPASLRRLAIG